MGITNDANIAQGERYCSVTESQTYHIGSLREHQAKIHEKTA